MVYEADDFNVVNISDIKGLKSRKTKSRNQGRIIQELSVIYNELDRQMNLSDRLLKLFLQKFGFNKTKKVLKNLSNSSYYYLCSICTDENYKTMASSLNDIAGLSYFKIIDFLNTLKELDIKDSGSVKILSRSAIKLKSSELLMDTLKLPDNYIKEILYNRPHFNFQAKISCICNAAKNYRCADVIKYGNLFLNYQQDGNVSLELNRAGGESRALGLFTGDMRFINQYELNIVDKKGNNLSPDVLNYENNNYHSCENLSCGKNIEVKREKVINGAFFENILIKNRSNESVSANISVSFDIRDIFEVRGKIFTPARIPSIDADSCGNLIINTEMESGVYGLVISIKDSSGSLHPLCINKNQSQLTYQINVPEHYENKISVVIQPLYNYSNYIDGEISSDSPLSIEEAKGLINNSKRNGFSRIKIQGKVDNIQKTLDKCFEDLNMLVNYINIDGQSYRYISAGIPRYSALFGRDSIITALQLLSLNQDISKETLELLAYFQGKSFEERYSDEITSINQSDWALASRNTARNALFDYYNLREEKEGKILHELRVGEFAKTGAIPHCPYYGSVDSTPLWLILLGEYYRWSKNREFIKKLLPNAERAVNWILSNLQNKYLRFSGSMDSKVRIQNQGWKDAGDSIKHLINRQGYLCDPEYPIALAEVQGYVYRAFILMSEIYSDFENKELSAELLSEAEKLKDSFNKDFWMNEKRFYSMALDRNNIPVPNITSNIGHCLAMGIISMDSREAVEEKLLSDELYTGWGIRTLSSESPAYDTLSYHNGSVWVHDTAFTAVGMSKKSMDKLTRNLFEAANAFENNRLPELFAGFSRGKDNFNIIPYPEACSPQAWASGSLPWLLTNLIGLKIDGENITIDEKFSSDWLESIEIKNIQTGNKTFCLKKQFNAI